MSTPTAPDYEFTLQACYHGNMSNAPAFQIGQNVTFTFEDATHVGTITRVGNTSIQVMFIHSVTNRTEIAPIRQSRVIAVAA